MAKLSIQAEKDIAKTINFLKHTDPSIATREHAIELLCNMQSLANLITNKVVKDKRKAKTTKCPKT